MTPARLLPCRRTTPNIRPYGVNESTIRIALPIAPSHENVFDRKSQHRCAHKLHSLPAPEQPKIPFSRLTNAIFELAFVHGVKIRRPLRFISVQINIIANVFPTERSIGFAKTF